MTGKGVVKIEYNSDNHDGHWSLLVTRQNSEEIEKDCRKHFLYVFPVWPWLAVWLSMHSTLDCKNCAIIFWQSAGFGNMCQNDSMVKCFSKWIYSPPQQIFDYHIQNKIESSTLSKKARKAITSQVRNLSNRLSDCCLLLSKSHPRNKTSLVMDFILKY